MGGGDVFKEIDGQMGGLGAIGASASMLMIEGSHCPLAREFAGFSSATEKAGSC